MLARDTRNDSAMHPARNRAGDSNALEVATRVVEAWPNRHEYGCLFADRSSRIDDGGLPSLLSRSIFKRFSLIALPCTRSMSCVARIHLTIDRRLCTQILVVCNVWDLFMCSRIQTEILILSRSLSSLSAWNAKRRTCMCGMCVSTCTNIIGDECSLESLNTIKQKSFFYAG